MNKTISSYTLRGGASILAYNPNKNQLIAAGQQNFQLFSIDQSEQFHELHDFRTTPLQTQISRWSVLQPKDVVWNLNNESCFATASGTNGSLFIWDASRLTILKQINLHQGTINRILFHPKYPNVLLTASQDGYAKLIDIRLNDQDKLISNFRHSSREAFRDIDINPLITEKFAAVIHNQYSVPIWDLRQTNSIDYSILTREKVLSIAWNPSEHFWLATGGIGGHDRTIRIWDAKGNDSRQEALFTVYTYGQVPKLSWHPGEKYQIACFTRKTDFRIHVWDVRRAYLPQMSFCHHRNEIEDFLWRSTTDSIISIGRDERLIHAPVSSAIKSEDIVSFYSLNVTSKGSVHITMPNIDNEYIQSLFINRHPSILSSSRTNFYSYQTLQTYSQWNQSIRGKSLLAIYSNSFHDQSIEDFHYLAKKWKFENLDNSLENLAQICDDNSHYAEEINRYDLSNTWKVIKMLYTNCNHGFHSSKNSRSLTKNRYRTDSRRKLTLSIEKQVQLQQEKMSYLTDEKRTKSNSKLESIVDMDTYIIRESFPDDFIFLTSNDLLQNQSDEDISIDSNAFSQTLMGHRTTSVTYIEDDNELESEDEYENLNHTMQTSCQSMILDSSEQFFTINEHYCPTISNSTLDFDSIIRETLFYYVENNALQMAVHLLLAVYPQLNCTKQKQSMNGTYTQWIIMYIELLQKMRLFVKAQQVTKYCIEKDEIRWNYDSQIYDGTMIFQAHTPVFQRLPVVLSTFSSSTRKSLSSTILKEFICTICRLPCRGLFTFCGVCFHGGHIDHIEIWFRTHDECPYACGHRCDSQHHRNSTTQHFISKSSIVFQ